MKKSILFLLLIGLQYAFASAEGFESGMATSANAVWKYVEKIVQILGFVGACWGVFLWFSDDKKKQGVQMVVAGVGLVLLFKVLPLAYNTVTGTTTIAP